MKLPEEWIEHGVARVAGRADLRGYAMRLGDQTNSTSFISSISWSFRVCTIRMLFARTVVPLWNSRSSAAVAP